MQKNAIAEQVFDFVFIGLGAGNSLMLMALLKKNCLTGKKVAILELDDKKINDKTYCFWAHPNEDLVEDLASIISYRYEKIELPKGRIQSISKQSYFYIRSIDFYNETLQLCEQHQIPIYRVAVDTVIPIPDCYQINTNAATTLYAQTIFDSRAPVFDTIDKNAIFINQSFFGFQIKTKENVFDPCVFEMMNFDVDQAAYTQFVYVLPYSTTEALVELTRFGKEKIDINYAKKTLDDYISKLYGAYEIVEQEVGNIPMTTLQFPTSSYPGIIHTGARANLIKPSTGYGFKNMYLYARAVSNKIATNQFNGLHQYKLHNKSRFQFYDRLLLIILNFWPQYGKKIFSSLFKFQKAHIIFDFLDEKTKRQQEIKIFATLPLVPFLKALYLYSKQEHLLRYVVLIAVAITYLTLKAVNIQIASIFSNTTILLGLLFLGLPHGAVDHLLLINKKTPLLIFILKYLLIVFAYFVCWHFYPTLSLCFFLLFSSFHFGEAEFKERYKNKQIDVSTLSSCLLGLSILFAIIFSHYPTSVQIISYISPGIKYSLQTENWKIYALLLVVASCLYISVESYRKEGKLPITLLLILCLGMLLPLALAFGLYFIFQHSYNAWQHLQTGLAISSQRLFNLALPYTLGAIFIGLLFYLLSSAVLVEMSQYGAVFFIFLACISLPHFVLMHIFYKHTH